MDFVHVFFYRHDAHFTCGQSSIARTRTRTIRRGITPLLFPIVLVFVMDSQAAVLHKILRSQAVDPKVLAIHK